MARIGSRSVNENGQSDGSVSGVSSENTIDPRNIVYTEAGSIEGTAGSAEAGTVEPVKRRGRPPGSKNGTTGGRQTSKAVPVDVNSLTFSLTGIHALLAAGLGAPELLMSEDDGKIIGSAAAAVARHYDLQASQKAIDWGNLVVALGAFYGPRIIAIRARRKQERSTKTNRAPVVEAQMAGAPVSARPGTVKPNGAGLATHTPTEVEKMQLLNETVAPMFQ
jgi:hypothetical protein